MKILRVTIAGAWISGHQTRLAFALSAGLEPGGRGSKLLKTKLASCLRGSFRGHGGRGGGHAGRESKEEAIETGEEDDDAPLIIVACNKLGPDSKPTQSFIRGDGLVDAAHIARIFLLQAEANRTGLKCNQTDGLFLASYLALMDQKSELFADYLKTQCPLIKQQTKHGAKWRCQELDINEQRVKMLSKCVNKVSN